MKRILFIHIGFGKTGTSALQKFFILNEDKLLSIGIYYPVTGRHTLDAHHYMATAVRPGGGTGFDTDTSWERYLEHLADELEHRSESKILISSEIFSGKVIFGKLQLLTQIFSEIRVISYLRRQDDLTMSTYNQWVKSESLGCKINELKILPYYYDKSLDSWHKTFSILGSDMVNIVRPYEKGQLYKDDVLADFMHHVFDTEINHEYRIPNKDAENLKLSLNTLEYKRILNQFCPVDIAIDMLKPLELYNKRETQNNIFATSNSLLSPQQRRELLAHYAERNEIVATKYLGRKDGNLFYDTELPDELNWSPHTLSLEDAIDISMYILHMKYPGENASTVYTILEKALKIKLSNKVLSVDKMISDFNNTVKIIDSDNQCVTDKVEAVIRACVNDIYGGFTDRKDEDLIAARWAV